MVKKSTSSKALIGWREWCMMPDLGIQIIKAKIDTGARTSALHAFDITPFERGSKNYVTFKIHPLQRVTEPLLTCTALLAGQRNITTSCGTRENRYVIHTNLVLGGVCHVIEVTLTNRTIMGFRMLLGRKAIKSDFHIHAGRSFLLGNYSSEEIERFYQ